MGTISRLLSILILSSFCSVEKNVVVGKERVCAFAGADFSSKPDTNSCPEYCYNFTDESVNAISWEWTFTDGTPATYSGQQPPLICFDTSGTYQVRLIVNDGSVDDTMKIDLVIESYCDTAIFIPNVITPNGDFRNDQFKIRNLPDQFNLVIYNRWGNEIFVSSDKSKLWPEKTDADEVTEGVYYYILQILDPARNQQFKGAFTVIKNAN